MSTVSPTFPALRRLDLQWGLVEISLAADEMQADVVRLEPAGGPMPGPKAMQKALEQAGIVHGIESDQLEAALRRATDSGPWRGSLAIAQGTPPTPGLDARIELAVDLDTKPGTARGDGSIDLRERHLVHNVNEGQLLGHKKAPTPGRDGQTVSGTPIAAPAGADIDVVAGDHVDLDEASGEYRSAIDGVASWEGKTICVSPLFRLDGDIDYTSGDLDVDCAVYIGGTVRSGFKVTARGATVVAGSIEDGASLQIRGDLTVGGGIIGAKTRVGITGDLRCHFIQNASVSARGHVWVGSYIRNASVRGGASLTVERGGGRLGGNINGGHTSAGTEVQLHTLGGVAETPTILEVAGDLVSQKETARLQREQAFCDTNIAKMMRTLGLKAPTPEAVRRLLPSVAPGKRRLYLKILQQLNLLLKRRRALNAELNRLQRDMAAALARASVLVSGALFPRAEVRLGQAVYSAASQTSPGALVLQGTIAVFKPQTAP